MQFIKTLTDHKHVGSTRDNRHNSHKPVKRAGIFFGLGNVLVRKAIKISSNEKSFKLFLAKALYHSNSNKAYKESINLLWDYIESDEFPVEAWHYLGLNFGKIKKFDLSSYALAEKYLLVNEIKNAKMHIQRVKKISKDKVLLNKIADLEEEIRKKEKR